MCIHKEGWRYPHAAKIRNDSQTPKGNGAMPFVRDQAKTGAVSSGDVVCATPATVLVRSERAASEPALRSTTTAKQLELYCICYDLIQSSAS